MSILLNIAAIQIKLSKNEVIITGQLLAFYFLTDIHISGFYLAKY